MAEQLPAANAAHDSVTSVIAPILGGSKNYAGHAFMTELSLALSALAKTHELAVLLTNNTVADRDVYVEGATKAALGGSWAGHHGRSARSWPRRSPGCGRWRSIGGDDRGARPVPRP